MNTETITDVIAKEAMKLPDDKRMHIAASHGLCLFAESYDDTKISSPFCILRGALYAFQLGLLKEYTDKGKVDEIPNVEMYFREIEVSMQNLYDNYIENVDNDNHRGDLYADLIGIGHYVMNDAIRDLNYTLAETKEKGTTI